ncbi:LysE family translocator [Kiloniella sp.]|uniref:LysE family translocator n=1 Tax=Kiloniella sp. TaxID=1938587 RepID=UPI003B01766C
MIDLTVLPLFFTAIFFLVISPGPDLVLITAYSSTRGFRFGLMITLGIFLAGVIQTLLVAFGLGQLMQAMPAFAYGVKIVGALYLAWLGFRMLKSWYGNKHLSTVPKKASSLSALDFISKGLLSNLLNPKALIFFSLFIPQFTRGSEGLSLQILILGTLLCCCAFLANFGFSLLFSKLGRVLGDKLKSGKKNSRHLARHIARHSEGLLGLVFVGLATRLATSK